MSTFDDDLAAALDTGDRQRIEAESQRLAQFEQRIRAEERGRIADFARSLAESCDAQSDAASFARAAYLRVERAIRARGGSQ